MKKVISLLSLLVLIPGGSLLFADPSSSSSLIDQAEAVRKEAAALEYEWRDTAKLISSAKESLEKGQKEESDKLASEALRQGREAVAQAKFMEKNWQSMIPRK